MSRFTILLAGPIRPTAALRAAVGGTRVIAADAGIRHAAALGVEPELWVGDFDSERDEAAGAGVPRLGFSTDKDETDGEIAIRLAVKRGASDLLLVGAFGGRTDHAFAHLILALREAERGRRVELRDGTECGIPLPEGKTLRVPARPGAAFSILKFGDLDGLTIRNARYPLEDVAVPFLSILTQSNEALGPVELRLRRGRAIVLVQEEGRT